MTSSKKKNRPPTSFITVIIITLLTVMVWPLIMINMGRNVTDNDNWVMIAFFPIYAVLSVYLAYRTHNERRGIAWILIVLVWLSFGSVILLA